MLLNEDALEFRVIAVHAARLAVGNLNPPGVAEPSRGAGAADRPGRGEGRGGRGEGCGGRGRDGPPPPATRWNCSVRDSRPVRRKDERCGNRYFERTDVATGPREMLGKNAPRYCAELSRGGFHDWRLNASHHLLARRQKLLGKEMGQVFGCWNDLVTRKRLIPIDLWSQQEARILRLTTQSRRAHRPTLQSNADVKSRLRYSRPAKAVCGQWRLRLSR